MVALISSRTIKHFGSAPSVRSPFQQRLGEGCASANTDCWTDCWQSFTVFDALCVCECVCVCVCFSTLKNVGHYNKLLAKTPLKSTKKPLLHLF